MTTVLLLLLVYVVATVVFVRWMKTHAPEGFEDDVHGFIMTSGTPVVKVEAVQSEVALAGSAPAWATRPSGR
jgi:hypothetical protein